MKAILSFFLVLYMSLPALAAGPRVIFSNYSAADGNAVYSSAFRVTPSTLKSVYITGAESPAGTFASLSGTALLQCAPTSNGPWITCKDRGNTAVSTTSNATFNMEDAVLFVRGSWQKTSGKVKVWITEAQ